MYLKALEIQGFKSFPDKTVLNFGEDITAIVGPNGSGKSNISDAICWVMGGQSARSLRGSKMEDVIFSGTEKRGPVGFAQVTLVLDNSERIFPSIDSSEVMVTRRYYRSGESEYYINKQSVRLRDINELFMDTGLGREGYSMIGQGRIAEILSAKSADRREIFEEAAGISKFRHRKEETERKLDRTEENLVRINDKIAELELQVEPLRGQAEKAKRYLLLRDELRVLEISVWMEKLDELRTGLIKLRADHAAASKRAEEMREKQNGLYEEDELLMQQTRDNDLEQERVRQAAAELEGKARDQESDIEVLRTSIQHNQESMTNIELELAQQVSRSQGISDQIAEKDRRIAEIDSRCAALEQELDELLEKARAAVEAAGSVAEEAQALHAGEALAVAAAADSRAQLSALEAGAAQMEERRAALEQEQEAAEARLETAKKDSRRAARDLEDAEDEANAIRNIIQGHTLRMAGRVEKEKEAAERVTDLTIRQNNLESRLQLLTQLERDYEGFNNAVRAVMQAAGHGALRGIHGPVANLIRVDSRYAVAIEIALGAGLQNVVVDREEDAKGAMAFLKQKNAGRATFLPLTAIRGEQLREKGIEDEFGFVGIASDLVAFDEKYRNVFQNLLGRTVVADDIDCGIAMARKYQNRFRIVTLDGQVLNRGGSMTGGSISQKTGILSRANELEKLKKDRETLRERMTAAQKAKEEITRELNAARYELETAEGQRRSAEDAVLKLQGEVSHCRSLLENLKQTQENLEGEKTSLELRLADSRSRMAKVRAEIAEKEAEAERLRQAAAEKSAGQSELLSRSSSISEAVSQKKEALAALAAERGSTEAAKRDMEQVQSDIEGDQAARQSRLEEYRAANRRTEQEISQKTEAAASLRLQLGGCRKELEVLQEAKFALEQKRGELTAQTRECNEQLRLAEQAESLLQSKMAAGNTEEAQIVSRLWDTYEINQSDAEQQRIELESVAKANRRIGELKREINSLGNVNVGAIEEFERVNTRYTYLSEQRDDVEKAKSELLGIIEEITKEMKVIFAEQFKLINTSFRETFQELFGGGQADLELEDPNDILSCGIEIKVQPPGKTLRTLSLLSGGEKAFVAIALYFAILKVHPTPFCVMDEIEAALDEANVVRYARYMRNLSDKTQFIVITHRRGTMEEADVLYGVTMQEKGVSKMLTMNLNDVAKELKIK